MKLITLNLKPPIDLSDWTIRNDGRTDEDLEREFRRAYAIAPELAVKCAEAYWPAEIAMNRRLSIRASGGEPPDRGPEEQALWDEYFRVVERWAKATGTKHIGAMHGFPYPSGGSEIGLRKRLEPIIKRLCNQRIREYMTVYHADTERMYGR